MGNRVNQVVSLDNGEDYVILKQAIYKGDSFYIASKLIDNIPSSSDLTFFHQIETDDKLKLEKVTDMELIKYLYAYMQF